jgi:hypothetical protein
MASSNVFHHQRAEISKDDGHSALNAELCLHSALQLPVDDLEVFLGTQFAYQCHGCALQHSRKLIGEVF